MQTLVGLEAAMRVGWGRGAALGALLGMIAACRPSGEEPRGDVGCPGCVADAGAPAASGPDSGSPGPVPPPRGATAWADTSDAPGHERSAGVAPAPGDTTYVAEVHGLTLPYSDVGADDVTLRLRRVDATGATRWTQSFAVSPVEGLPGDPTTREAALRAWITSSTDRVFVAGNVRGTIHGLSTGGFLLASNADGVAQWGREFPHDEVLAVAARPAGSVWVAVREHQMEPGCARGLIALIEVSADGLVQRRLHPTGTGSDCFGDTLDVRTITTTPGGGVLFGGAFSGSLRLGDVTYDSATYSPVLGEVDAAGAVVWSAAFAHVSGEVTHVARRPDGAQLFTGTFRDGTLRWGDAELLASGGATHVFVLAASAQRAPTWAASLGAAEHPVAAVTPNDSAVVAHLSRSTGRPLLTVVELTPGGVPAWSRAFPRAEGPADLFAEGLEGIVVEGDAVTIGGQFSHPTDFGEGLVTPVQTDTVLLRLTP